VYHYKIEKSIFEIPRKPSSVLHCALKSSSFVLFICCNLSVGVSLNVRFTTNGMCAKNNTHIYVTRTSNNRVIVARDLYCCLLPQCEALRVCRSGFPIATVGHLHLQHRHLLCCCVPSLKLAKSCDRCYTRVKPFPHMQGVQKPEQHQRHGHKTRLWPETPEVVGARNRQSRCVGDVQVTGSEPRTHALPAPFKCFLFVSVPRQTNPMQEKHRLLTTRQLANQERQATTRPVSDGLNAVPTTNAEKVDCKRMLTPQVREIGVFTGFVAVRFWILLWGCGTGKDERVSNNKFYTYEANGNLYLRDMSYKT